MTNQPNPAPTFYTGWHTYQSELIKAIASLSDEHLLLKAAPKLRTVGQIATHMIGARAQWFYMGWEEGGDTCKKLGGWDRRGRKPRTATEQATILEEAGV